MTVPLLNELDNDLTDIENNGRHGWKLPNV